MFRAPAIDDVGRAAAAFENVLATPLDLRTEAVTRLGALIALDARAASSATAVDTAIGAGVTTNELVALVLALAPEVGAARVVAPAPALFRLGPRRRAPPRDGHFCHPDGELRAQRWQFTHSV